MDQMDPIEKQEGEEEEADLPRMLPPSSTEAEGLGKLSGVTTQTLADDFDFDQGITDEELEASSPVKPMADTPKKASKRRDESILSHKFPRHDIDDFFKRDDRLEEKSGKRARSRDYDGDESSEDGFGPAMHPIKKQKTARVSPAAWKHSSPSPEL
jgi:hypothetical protein